MALKSRIFVRLTIESSDVFHCYLAVAPDSRHSHVQLPASETSERGTQVLPVDNEAHHALVHVKHHCKKKPHFIHRPWYQDVKKKFETYKETCPVLRKIRLVWDWMGMENQSDFLSRGRPCSGPNPNPTSVHYFLRGSGIRHYELERPLKLSSKSCD